jgi:hypothetical protein
VGGWGGGRLDKKEKQNEKETKKGTGAVGGGRIGACQLAGSARPWAERPLLFYYGDARDPLQINPYSKGFPSFVPFVFPCFAKHESARDNRASRGLAEKPAVNDYAPQWKSSTPSSRPPDSGIFAYCVLVYHRCPSTPHAVRAFSAK